MRRHYAQPRKQDSKRETLLSLLAILLTSQKMDMNKIFDLVELLNGSMQLSKDCIMVLEDTFLNDKSAKILFAIDMLEYLVKNCNRNLHQACNTQQFMDAMLHLVRRQRGKFTIVEKMRSNMDNWTKIEAKTLYIIQLWYDAFMLQEQHYKHLIHTYKTLRQENILFPPRQQNQRNMLAVKTESPIFDHLEQISEIDQKKFEKKKIALGLSGDKMIRELEKADRPNQDRDTPNRSTPAPRHTDPVVDLTELQELIAIIRSLDFLTEETRPNYEKLRNMVENHKKPKFSSRKQEAIFNQIVEQGEKVISQWEEKLKENTINQENEYMRKKLQGSKMSKKESPTKKTQNRKQEPANLLDFEPEIPKLKDNVFGDFSNEPQKAVTPQPIDLLDL